MAEVNASIMGPVRRFLRALQEHGISVDAAYLFGSCAKGVEGLWSDIDVAVISSSISDDRFEERIRFTKLSSQIDSRIEPVPFSPETFVDEDPLAYEIKKEGIRIEYSAH